MKKSYFILLVFVILCLLSIRKVYAEVGYDYDCDLYKEQLADKQVFSQDQKGISITDDDIYLMAQIVKAESNSEPYEGKVAVASVILNRLRDPSFPKTVEGVITQKDAFSCLINGTIDIIPDSQSYTAVLEALKGIDPTEKAVFFYNPIISTSPWMLNVTKVNCMSIGHHVFFH